MFKWVLVLSDGHRSTKGQASSTAFERESRKAKMELLTLTQTNISLPFITTMNDGPSHIDTTLKIAK
nr:stromal 70 kDa heat shock-related protein, chloroplastic-like [Tanacetum cinerariifolium]